MLNFYTDLLEDFVREDGLAILGEGLGLVKLVAAMVRLQAEQQGGLVLIIGAYDWQRQQLTLELEAAGVGDAPAHITAEMSIPERLKLYSAGGCLFVTTRILVVDFLTERLPPSAVGGIVILNAHRVQDASGESFAVRLLRAGGNATAFVRALSDRPGELVRGFGSVDRVLKALLVRQLYLLPRFHLSVRGVLEARPPDVVELSQPLPRSMLLIQEAIVSVTQALLKDLKSSRQVDTSDLTMEDGLFKSFDLLLQKQLGPIWHAVPRKTRQVVYDLRTLRTIGALPFAFPGNLLLQYDCVTFLSYLEVLKEGEGQESVWLFADAAHTIYDQARKRVYAIPAQPAAAAAAAAQPKPAPVPVLEPMPKWGLLEDVVKEARGERARMEAEAAKAGDTPEAAVLVAVRL